MNTGLGKTLTTKWVDHDFYRRLKMNPLDLKSKFDGLKLEETSVLDLGCGGYGTPISSQMKVLPFKRLISIDAHKPTFDKLHREIDYAPFAAKSHVCRNREALLHLNDAMSNAYDVVLMLDVLEHFDKSVALKIIKESKRVAWKRVMIWLPLGDCPQGDIAGNPWQKHLSTWTKEELEELGFAVEVFPEFHTHFNPPVDAAWAFWEKATEQEEVAKDEKVRNQHRYMDDKRAKPEGKGIYFEKVKRVLVDRLDVHGDVLVCTSVLPGLREKYPDAKIDWHVRKGYGFALENNPYINRIIPGPVNKFDTDYDLVVTPDHHGRWNKPMAMIHCEQAGVEFHKPELYLTQEEINAVPEELRDAIVVANTAGWSSRVCPNLNPVLTELTEIDHHWMVQLDNGPDISSSIGHTKLTLREAAALMHHAKLYIGIDTVFMHMAVALGKPMVLCMGPTDQYTQYTPNATIIKPYEWTNPAEPYPDTKDGIQIPEETILIGIRTKLDEDGYVVDKKPRRKMISYVTEEDYENIK